MLSSLTAHIGSCRFTHQAFGFALTNLLAFSLCVVTVALNAGCAGGSSAPPPPPPPAQNPVPSITSLSPSTTTVGAQQQPLTIQGTNFLSSSTVTYNGQTHPATFVSSTQLTISLSASDQSTAGNYPVSVTNPAPGGGPSNSVNFTVNNPAPALTAISPSVLAAGSPETAITLTGSNFVTQSAVNFNGTTLPTTFVSSTQLSVTIPASSLASPALNHLTVSSPSPGGGTSAVQTLTVTVVGSFVIMATPVDSSQQTGSWHLVVAAVNSNGVSIPGLPVSLNSSAGTISQIQGLTDSFGTFRTSVSPPASYSGQAVAVGATTGSQTAAINIAFVSSSFNPTAAIAAPKATYSANSSSTNTATTTTLSSPFVFGLSSSAGATNPFFLSPDLCYSNVDLATTVPTDCQFVYSNQSVVRDILDTANTVCNAAATVTDIVGGAACVGVAATMVSCALAPTGVGAVICAGGLTYSGVLSEACLAALSDILIKHLLENPTDQGAVHAIGIQTPDLIGLICDAIPANGIGIGTGISGTQVTISPPRQVALLGATVHFTAVVNNNANTNVTWSVNGVTGGSGPFGTVDNNGLYTAPLAMPPFAWVTVRATSVADPTASAPAVLHVVANLPGTITTVAGNGTAGYMGDNGPAISAELFSPSGVAFDGGGNMFIADFKNNVVRRVDAATGVITTIAGTGVAGYFGDGGPAIQAQLNGPSHVVFDRTVNLYITDANNNRIRRVNARTGTITTVAGNGVAGFFGDGGPATSAQLQFPDGIGLDGAENIYIGDALNNRIRKVDVATGLITTVAGNGVAGFAGDGGTAINAELNFPSRPALDSFGNLYIADFNNNRVRRVDASTGVITTVAGTGTLGFFGDGGAASFAELNGPISVTVDLTGNLYIGDINNERIRAVNTTSNPLNLLNVSIQPNAIETVAGTGSAGYSGDGGPATSARINFPTGLLIDNQGNLYFADANNNVVRRVTGQPQ